MRPEQASLSPRITEHIIRTKLAENITINNGQVKLNLCHKGLRFQKALEVYKETLILSE